MQSAKPPSYREAHDLIKNTIFAVSECRPLQPHQTQFVAWASRVEAELKCWLLANDMGLGKTTAALAYLCHYASVNGAELDNKTSADVPDAPPPPPATLGQLASKTSADIKDPSLFPPATHNQSLPAVDPLFEQDTLNA